MAVGSAKAQVADKLKQQRAEYEFASADLADQLERSRAAEKTRNGTLAQTTADLDKTLAELKQTKASLIDLETKHNLQGETCKKQEK